MSYIDETIARVQEYILRLSFLYCTADAAAAKEDTAATADDAREVPPAATEVTLLILDQSIGTHGI
ncbi:hypothetical protein BCON_0289g00080 [Botryotinia convoluta]|uniref:Uncharacterized protein n=1 Tax=Botryotinia convoluta TaxID=54673 RepID=A0A4Z1HK93_9HELO|nr:hypothetical protein BCON_0289g00080 [Botryotinia convoluta]